MTTTAPLVLIPAYNEASTIADVVQRVLAQAAQVVVIDDGSTDGTADRLRHLPVTVLRNNRNKGKAASLRCGFEWALARGKCGVLTLDGDGQHAPEYLPRLLEAAQQSPEAIILGAREPSGDPVPRARRAANTVADFWVSWAAGRRIRDTQTGFRRYPRAALELALQSGDRASGFVFESEILIDASRAGIPIHSVGVPAVYRFDARPSHFRPIYDIAAIVLMVAGKLLARGLYLTGLWRSLAG